jgi:hypothetical protein
LIPEAREILSAISPLFVQMNLKALIIRGNMTINILFITRPFGQQWDKN